jgi:phage gp46-like protein
MNILHGLLLTSNIHQAIAISLFTDARVTDEELPEGETSKKGWWADALDDSKPRLSKSA